MQGTRASSEAARSWMFVALAAAAGCTGQIGATGADATSSAPTTSTVAGTTAPDGDGDDEAEGDADAGAVDLPDAAGAGGAGGSTGMGGSGAVDPGAGSGGAGGAVAAGGSPPAADAGAPTGPWGLTGPVIPCKGQPRPPNKSGNAIKWDAIPATGVIGKNSAGQDIYVYVRDACPGQSPVRTVVIGASIHASENGGQTVAHELLFNKALPPDVRIVAIPEINKAGLTGKSPSPRFNKNGVNLNRNFDYKWPLAKQGSADASNPNFKGPSPASEPETQAIQGFLLAVGKAALVVSYHRDLNWVAPSGPNASTTRPMAQKYANLANHPFLYNNNGYGFFEAWYAAKTGTPALLVELSSSTAFAYLEQHANAVIGLLTP